MKGNCILLSPVVKLSLVKVAFALSGGAGLAAGISDKMLHKSGLGCKIASEGQFSGKADYRRKQCGAVRRPSHPQKGYLVPKRLVFSSHSPAASGFTLIEMLVVIAIIGIVASMLMGAIDSAMSSGRASSCGSNLRQIGLSLVLYSDNHDGLGPFATNAPKWDEYDPAYGTQSWMQQIFSYSVDKNLYKCPDNDKSEFAYYLGTIAAFVHANRKFASVRRSLIMKPTLFVAGGDVPKAMIAPASAVNYFVADDPDKDDYTQMVVGTDNHKGMQNFLFADSHFKAFADYDPNCMTYRYDRISDWRQE